MAVGSLFFVAGIYERTEEVQEYKPVHAEPDREETRLSVILEPVKGLTQRHSSSSFNVFHNIPLAKKALDGVQEGMFVTTRRDGSLRKANAHPAALTTKWINNYYRRKLLRRLSAPQRNTGAVSEAYVYHVHVGHGNCTFLVFHQDHRFHIWVVDCSDHDYTDHKLYRHNILKCVLFIMNKFRIPDFKVDKLFLTHTHYDHYSGIKFLSDLKFLQRTEVWLNPYYDWQSPSYGRCLKALCKNDVTVVEPVSRNSIPGINVWHPLATVVRQKPAFGWRGVTVAKTPNDASAVFQFELADRKYLFPGDIETAGWNRIPPNCAQFLNGSDFLCLSHHGSINGHLRHCTRRHIESIASCSANIKHAILMGRDKAFPGIFSRRVINDFGHRLVETEGNSFLEVELGTDSIRHH